MRLAWLGVLMCVGGVAPAAEDEAEPTAETGKYVVYQRTDYKGTVCYRIIPVSQYGEVVAEVARKNKALKQAYRDAAEAWKKDKRNKGAAFPMRPPKLLRLMKMSTYADKPKAGEAALKRQDKLDLRDLRLREREERRLSRLSEEAQAREKDKAKALARAEKLFDKALDALLAEKPAKKPPKQPEPEAP